MSEAHYSMDILLQQNKTKHGSSAACIQTNPSDSLIIQCTMSGNG